MLLKSTSLDARDFSFKGHNINYIFIDNIQKLYCIYLFLYSKLKDNLQNKKKMPH